MTTKIHYAMFAVAAIAAASFGITPAFADTTVSWTESVDAYDTDVFNDWSSCGVKAVQTRLQISEHSPGTEDLVRVNTDASRCYSGDYSAVTVTILKNNVQVLQNTSTNDLAEFTYPGPLVGGDTIKATALYYS